MKKRTPILAVILMTISQILVAEERDELGLREYILNKGFAIHAKTNEVCYISFGSSLPTNVIENQDISTQKFTVIFSTPPPFFSTIKLSWPNAIHTDPPPDFLKRFTGKHFVVKPASQYPKPKDKIASSTKKNPETGFPDALYTITILEWLNDTTAKVRYSMYRAPGWATGYDAIVEKKDRKWTIKEIDGTAWYS